MDDNVDDAEIILKSAIERIVLYDGQSEYEDLEYAARNLKITAVNVGLLPDDIVALVRCVCQNYMKLGFTVCSVIISALIPRVSVPDFAFVRAISWCCTATAPDKLQILLFRWMIAIFDVVDSKENVHRTYTVLFHLLQKGFLRPFVYQLLCTLTEKCDVTDGRVHTLIELSEYPDAEPYTSSLLGLFKTHKPELVPVKVPSKFVSGPKPIESVWRKFVTRTPAPGPDVPLWDSEDAFPDTVKDSHFDNDFPRLTSDFEMLTISKEPYDNSNAKSLLDVVSLDRFMENIDNLNVPLSSSTMLRYPLLQHVASYQKDEAALTKLRFRLHGTLTSKLCELPTGLDTDFAAKLLESVAQFSEYLQEGDPTVNTVLDRYMKYHWNGIDYAHLILTLVKHAPLFSVCQKLLEPLQNIFKCSQVEYQVAVLGSITELLSNRVHTEWVLLQKVEADVDRYWADESYHAKMVDQMSQHRLIPVNEDTTTLFLDSIIQLVEFTNKLCTFAMTSSDCNVIVCNAVLNFYETVVHLNLSWQIPLVITAPKPIIHLLIFCSDAISLSRMCQLFISYKTGMERIDALHQQWPRSWTVKCLSALPDINMLILECVDGLWRDKAFHVQSPSVDGDTSALLFPEEQFQQLNLSELGQNFSIIRHVALISYWHQFLQNRNEIENFSKSFSSLKSQKWGLIKEYLEYMTSCGLSGITNFLSTFVKMKP